MTISAAEEADRAEEAEDPIAGTAVAAVPGGGKPALRDVVVDLAFKPAGATRALLDDFLSEPAWAIALKLWFGDRDALGKPIRRHRILQRIDRDIAWLDTLLTEGTA